jgi:hypothetical protein
MKMNKIKREKKVATLSMVRSITISWRLSAGIKRTILSIRNKRNVRRTETPLADDFPASIRINCLITSYTLDLYKHMAKWQNRIEKIRVGVT